MKSIALVDINTDVQGTCWHLRSHNFTCLLDFLLFFQAPNVVPSLPRYRAACSDRPPEFTLAQEQQPVCPDPRHRSCSNVRPQQVSAFHSWLLVLWFIPVS